MGRHTATARGAVIKGIEAVPVYVTAGIEEGLPSTAILGISGAAAMEGAERVRCAIRSAGFDYPFGRIVVQASPADLPKRGTCLDFAIAAAILAASGQVGGDWLERGLFYGELGIDGSVRTACGSLAAQSLAESVQLRLAGNLEKTSCRKRIVANVSNLSQLREEMPSRLEALPSPSAGDPDRKTHDFSEIDVEPSALRAVLVAAAGGHSMLTLSPEGWGRDLLASRIPGILPTASDGQLAAVEDIYDIDGLDYWHEIKGGRPFRWPHHSATAAGLVGGGCPVRPGEVTLADRGVLYLDPIAEFAPGTLSHLRPALESGEIRITRADGVVKMPTRFMLVAGSNTCPCGADGGDADRGCSCSPGIIAAYQKRVGGPLRDSFDISIRLSRPVRPRTDSNGVSSAELGYQVERARAFAARRKAGNDKTEIDPEARNLLSLAICRARIYETRASRLMAVARTIADLEESEKVTAAHMRESLTLCLGAL